MGEGVSLLREVLELTLLELDHLTAQMGETTITSSVRSNPGKAYFPQLDPIRTFFILPAIRIPCSYPEHRRRR